MCCSCNRAAGTRASDRTNYFYPSGGSTLTIGPGITIHGQHAYLGSTNGDLINQGTLHADADGQTIIVRGSSVTNDGGTLAASNGGTLNVNSLTGNVGSASATTGGHLDLDGTYTINESLPVGDATLTVRGDWTNVASIDSTNSTVNLDGTFTVEDLGTFNRTGTTANITGTLDIPAQPLTLDTETTWRLSGGTIRSYNHTFKKRSPRPPLRDT